MLGRELRTPLELAYGPLLDAIAGPEYAGQLQDRLERAHSFQVQAGGYDVHIKGQDFQAGEGTLP